MLAIGQGYGLSCEEKLESLRTLLGTYPIDRIQTIVGEKAAPVLGLYAEFLKALDTTAIRHSLEKCQDTSAFRDLSDKAGLFRDSLCRLFHRHFTDDNPTIRALLL